jgi:hypothetical protein
MFVKESSFDAGIFTCILQNGTQITAILLKPEGNDVSNSPTHHTNSEV